MNEFTADQIEGAIELAIRDHEFELVPPLIRLLAGVDAKRAERMLDTINLGINVRKTT